MQWRVKLLKAKEKPAAKWLKIYPEEQDNELTDSFQNKIRGVRVFVEFGISFSAKQRSIFYFVDTQPAGFYAARISF